MPEHACHTQLYEVVAERRNAFDNWTVTRNDGTAIEIIRRNQFLPRRSKPNNSVTVNWSPNTQNFSPVSFTRDTRYFRSIDRIIARFGNVAWHFWTIVSYPIDAAAFLGESTAKKKSTFLSLPWRGKRIVRFGKEERKDEPYIFSRNQRYTWKTGGGRSIEGEIDRYRYPSQRGKENLFREWKSILFRNRLSSVPSERLLCVIELVHYSFRLIPPPSGTDFISVNEISCKIFLERDSFSRSIREKLVRNVRSLVSQISLFFYYIPAQR